jgi:AcrR family transcriptional regulator
VATAATSRQKPRGTSREHIIDVSRTIIEEEGVEQLTIRKIAERVNRTQPAVYQHFSSKDEILAAVVVEGFAALFERLNRATRGGKPSLSALANAYVRFGLERPRLYDVMFVAPPVITFADPAATPIPAQKGFKIIAMAVAECGVRVAEVESVTEAVWAALHGLVMLSITKRLRPGRALHHTRLEKLIEAIVAMTAST